MNNVIITGASGFIGRNTVKYFLDQNINVLALTSSENSDNKIIHNNLEYKKFDMFNLEAYENNIEKNKYDTFIHFAWSGSTAEKRNDYSLQMKNIIATVDCMKLAKKLGCRRFICAGSIMEYEIMDSIKRDVIEGGNIYGLAKFTAHSICKTVSKEIGIDLVWAIITNSYGPGENSTRFINSTLNKIANKEKLNFTSCTQNYDFIYIDDVARAFYCIAKYGKDDSEYVIGSGEAKPLKEFVKTIIDEIGNDIKYSFGTIPYSGINLSIDIFNGFKLKNECKFECQTSFSEGIYKTYKWIENGRKNSE